MDPFIREYENELPVAKQVIDINEFTGYFNEEYDDLKILHLNIRSVMKNMDELSIVLSKIPEKIDVIVLSETYVVQDLQVIHMNGYQTLYNKGSLNKNDGVIIFIKEILNYTHTIESIAEIKALQITVEKKAQNISITAFYRSPSTCPIQFNNELVRYLESIKNNNAIQIITGDLNIDLLSELDYAEEYKNIMNAYGFVSYINDITRPSSGSCIDHFFIKNKTQAESKSFIIHCNITDHFPIGLILDLKNKSTLEISNKYKKFINYTNLKQLLRNESWVDLYNEKSTDRIFKIFIEKLKLYVDQNTVTKKIKNCNRPRTKWITPEIIKLVNRKNELYKRVIRNTQNTILREEYNKMKSNLKKLITTAKKIYMKNLIEENKNSTKGLWDSVNKICNNNTKKTVINKIKVDNQTVIKNKIDICNSFNEYYSTLGEIFASKITEPTAFYGNEERVENTMYLYPTSENEVEYIIKQLKSKKAPGDDNIRAELLKQIVNEIRTPLVYLMNRSLETGIFPKILKLGLIKPLYKSGDKLERVNYRPLSLISNVAKILEKIIKIRIVKFLNKHKVISDKQYGFREGKSTDDAIFALTTYIYDALDKKKATLCIFVDLSKAFDTVCHKKLLNKMYIYGLRGNTYNLIKSYLSDREQRVNIDSVISHYRTVSYGIPQGTVLGPLLFTIYINGLLEMKTKGTILSFADDTAILYRSNTWQELQTLVENDFIKIEKWFRYNKLTLNFDKTRYLPFCSYANGLPNMGPLKIGTSYEIPEGKMVKYLGIVIDRHLRWDQHIKSLVGKLRGLLYRFRWLSDFLDIKLLTTLYYALVESQLQYGIVGWGGVNNCYLENVNVVQKYIIKVIYRKAPTYPSDELFRESKLLDTRQLYSLSMLKHINKGNILINNLEHSHDTRNKINSFVLPSCNKSIGQRNPIYLGPRLYSILPEELRACIKKTSFRKKAKNWIKETGRAIFNDFFNQYTK